jgi:hypothetical protein
MGLTKDDQELHSVLTQLQDAQWDFQAHVDSLYASLALPPKMETLGDVDCKFLHLLIQYREAKMVIREKALRTLFEMDRLEQAISGANNPLGTG